MAVNDKKFAKQYGKTHGRYSYDYEKTGQERIYLEVFNDTDMATNSAENTMNWVAPRAGSVIAIYCDLDGTGDFTAGDDQKVTVDLQKDAGAGAATVLTTTGSVEWKTGSYEPAANVANYAFGTDGTAETGVTAVVLDAAEVAFAEGDTLVFNALAAVTQAQQGVAATGLRCAFVVEYS
jgi:hypothetical protein